MDAIKKDLPEATAGALKEFIEEKKIIVGELKIANKKNDDLSDKLVDAANKINELLPFKAMKCQLDSEKNELIAFEKDLNERHTEIRINEAISSERRDSSNDRIDDFKFMFSTVFKNTEIKKSTTKNHVVKMCEINSGYSDNNGVPIMQDGGEMVEEKTDVETTEEQ